MSIVRKLRQRILTPSMSAATVARRGFHSKSSTAVALLETVGHTFLTGYGYATGSATITDTVTRLETVPRRFRGFAYEGAAMGFAMLVGLRLAPPKRLFAFLTGRAEIHRYMAYIGIGWACARLPRWRWPAVLPADPVLGWLVLDGYGFHQAYFHTRRYVYDRHQDHAIGQRFGRPGDYAARAVDQGIGRALWFVEGTDVPRLVDRIATFPEHRRADLWSGAALALTYAGGAGDRELGRFWSAAEKYRPNVAQGCAFAAEARFLADLVTEHTATATAALCGMTPPEAAAVTRLARVGLPPTDTSHEPAYEVWRERIADRFASLGRC